MHKRYSIFSPFLLLLSIFYFTSCSTIDKVGLAVYTGYYELPFASNSYQAGQIVEIYSNPAKVEITYDPKIPWDLYTVSDGWEISAESLGKIKYNLSAEIAKIAQGEFDFVTEKNISVELTNTQTRIVPKYKIYSALMSGINSDEQFKTMLEKYLKAGIHFDVITNTLSADITFSIKDENNNAIKVDSELIKKINSKFSGEFNYDNTSNRVVSGNNLVVGIHYDPQMISIILNPDA